MESAPPLRPPGSSSVPSPSPSAASSVTIDSLLTRCRALLEELSQFETYLAQNGKGEAVDTRSFRGSVRSELKSLERISTADSSTPAVNHATRSSNLPFYEAVWKTAKLSRGLVVLSKRFYWDINLGSQPNKSKEPVKKDVSGRKPKKGSALVDIVTREGEEWIKVSTVTEARLLFEMAKVGWEIDSGDEGEDDDRKVIADGMKPLGLYDDQDDDRIELLKVTEDLQKAARATRVRYKHPQIRFVLPKIVEGRTPAVDSLITSIRANGILVDCCISHSASSDLPDSIDHRSILSVFPTLAPSPHPHLTPTLNIDCTVLLALISDLSHFQLAPRPDLHKAINRQITAETVENLLPTLLYPALNSRILVCSGPAANRMREIVGQIGTPAEKFRADIMLGEGTAAQRSNEELRALFQEHSNHDIPPELNLPLTVHTETISLEDLPEVATRLEPQLSEINRSVFYLGWARGWATVTSNRTVAKLIESFVEDEGGEGCIGPPVWICGPARSLVGKDTGHRQGKDWGFTTIGRFR